MIYFLSQWANSLQSLRRLVYEVNCSVPPPVNIPIPPFFTPSFPELHSVQIQFARPPSTMAPIHSPGLLQNPLPFITPSLHDLSIYLPPDHANLDSFVLPATPTKNLKVIFPSLPNQEVLEKWKSTVTDKVVFQWNVRWKKDLEVIGVWTGSIKRENTWDPEKKGMWKSFRNILGV